MGLYGHVKEKRTRAQAVPEVQKDVPGELFSKARVQEPGAEGQIAEYHQFHGGFFCHCFSFYTGMVLPEECWLSGRWLHAFYHFDSPIETWEGMDKEEYRREKEKIAADASAKLEKLYPDVKGHLEVVDCPHQPSLANGYFSGSPKRIRKYSG